MTQSLESIIMEAVDTHVHVGPDCLPRRYTLPQLVKTERGKIGGLVPKCHTYPTADGVRLLREEGIENSMILIPSIVFNAAAGWPNPEVIMAQVALNPDLPLYVWMATLDAANHIAKIPGNFAIPQDWVRDHPGFAPKRKSEVRPISVTDDQGSLTPETLLLLNTLVAQQCILGTGHLSSIEAQALAREARNRGVKQVVLTHPHEQSIAMTPEEMFSMAQLGVWIEVCAIPDLDRSDDDVYPATEEIGASIRQIGVEHVLLNSDTGQTTNGSPSEVLNIYCKKLMDEAGFTLEEIAQLLLTNPRRLLSR